MHGGARADRQGRAGSHINDIPVSADCIVAAVAIQRDVAQGQVSVHSDHADSVIAAFNDRCAASAGIGETVVRVGVRRGQHNGFLCVERSRYRHLILRYQHLDAVIIFRVRNIGIADLVVQLTHIYAVKGTDQCIIHGFSIGFAPLVIQQPVGLVRDLTDHIPDHPEIHGVKELAGIIHFPGLCHTRIYGEPRRVIRIHGDRIPITQRQEVGHRGGLCAPVQSKRGYAGVEFQITVSFIHFIPLRSL